MLNCQSQSPINKFKMFIFLSHFSFPSEHSGSDFSLEENGTSSNQADDDEYLTTQVAYETEVASNEETTVPAESKDVEMVDVAKPEGAVESAEASASTVTSSPTSSTLRSSDEDAIVPMGSKARRTTGKLTRNHDDFPANSSRRYQQAEEENNDSNA